MSQEQIQQFIDQSQQSLQSGQFQQALDLADQAIALEVNLTEAHVLRGIALSQLNRPDEATEAFRAAIMYGPYNPKAYFNLAVHYFQQGETMKAEEMAKEAMRIEPNHAGGRQLLASIEASRAAQQAPPDRGNAFPGDPLAAPPSDAAGDATSAPIPPAGTGAPRPTETPGPSAPYGGPQPGAPQPGAPMPTGYYRPGYDTSNVHSVSFIANMGKTWDTIGIILGVANVAVWAIAWIVGFSAMMKVFQNPEGARDMANMMGNTPGMAVLNILGWGTRLFSLIWMIMELVDRRGNWLWLIPAILCCCCGGTGIPQLIYIWKGRS